MNADNQATIDYSQMNHKGFDCMGSRINFWIDRSAGSAGAAAFSSGQIFLQRFDRELTRFTATSDLAKLNADPRDSVPVSSLLARFVDTALWAAQISEGLVDPTMADSMVEIGYAETLRGRKPAPLSEALENTSTLGPASPNQNSRWREIAVDLDSLIVTRPVGVHLDSGGSGKGLAADMLASIWNRLLPAGTPWIIDSGGDLRLGELAPGAPSYTILVNGPIEGDGAPALNVNGGAIATSGIGNRLWRNPDGSYSHHLLDPSTGRSAWTGVISVTAVAETATMAETISKTALLAGPEAAGALVADRGGVIVRSNGVVEEFPVREPRDAGADTKTSNGEMELVA